MRERRAEIWTRLAVQPRKMGSLYISEHSCHFTYDLDYLNSGLPGLGLVYAPAYFGSNTLQRRRTEAFDFLPPLQQLIPPAAEDNFIRRLILQSLHKKGVAMKDRFDRDWEILLHAAHGSIGHVDVFASDEEAQQWYGRPASPTLTPVGEDFGFSLKDFLTWFDEDASELLSIIGPTPSVGGMVPKLLLAIPESGWDGRIGLPTRYGDTQNTDIVLKLEKSSLYPGIVELEAMALDVHEAAGMRVPRYWRVDLAGVPALAIERFDRDAQRVPRFMESMYSILASADESLNNHYSASYDRIARAINSPDIQLVEDRKAAQVHLLQRLVLALLTGNGDLHLANLSLLAGQSGVEFSPVYDPAPMRAYSLHNAMLPGGMVFGEYGGQIPGQDRPVDFAQAMNRFISRSLGMGRERSHGVIQKALADTTDYPERIAALVTLPGVHKRRLLDIHRDMRSRLTAVLSQSRN